MENIPLLKSGSDYFNIDYFNSDVYGLVFLMGVNIVVNFVLVRLIYYPFSEKKKEYLFSFILTSIVVFILGFILKSKEIETGIAFGLFAVFSIIRFRTNLIPVKEMAYFFTVIGVSLMLALSKKINLSLAEIGFVVCVVLAAAFIMEILLKGSKMEYKELDNNGKIQNKSTLECKTIIYPALENIKPENHAILLTDLKTITGLDIKRIDTGKINLRKGEAELKIYYKTNIESKIHN